MQFEGLIHFRKSSEVAISSLFCSTSDFWNGLLEKVKFVPWHSTNRMMLFHTKYIHTLTCLIIVQQILLIFENIFTYTPLLRPTCLLISANFPSKHFFFTYVKMRKSTSYMTLLQQCSWFFLPTHLLGPKRLLGR